ncbi:MAG: DoxX family protein [Mucilaginibacter sp.]|uniref:DoxX family protein n=1 Tax=Mucilaginibacter sp. TaxID=1882438 RepID=UPI0031A83124
MTDSFQAPLTDRSSGNRDLLAPIRIAIGLTFLYHGSILWDLHGMREFSVFWGTHFNIPFPFVSIVLTKIIQFFGGLCMISGLFTRYAASAISCTMLVATIVAHKGVVLNIPAMHYITSGEGETAFVYLLLFVVFAIIGAGTFSLDNYFFGKKSFNKH